MMLKAAAFILISATAILASTSPVKHIIVLMEENRSFDHFLGHLKKVNPAIDGLDGKQGNPTDPLAPHSPWVPVNNNAVDGGLIDPCHGFDCVTQQIYGYNKPVANTSSPPLMNGFVANTPEPSNKSHVEFVMSAFNSSNLPVLSALALEYAVFDHWHCSVPSCTNPNREYMMSGTSGGFIDNTLPAAGFPQESHFNFLARHNVSFKIYYGDDPWMAPAFKDLRTAEHVARVQLMENFFWDLGNGTLPQYTLIQPRMATTSKFGISNWQHPDNSVSAGEQLISDVYTALKASSVWEESMLIITYDEHGGFMDHAKPQQTGVPSPDNIKGSNGFAFDRLGVRIPTVVVSPYIPKGTLVSVPTAAQSPFPTSNWDSTSIISTANKIFGISAAESMTARDAWAAHFEGILSSPAPRTDCLNTLPPAAPVSDAALEIEMNTPLNDHHLDSLNLLCHLANGAHPVCTSHRRSQQRAAFAALLEGYPAAPGWDYAQSTYPELYFPIVQRLRQRHFEDISHALFGRYKKMLNSSAPKV